MQEGEIYEGFVQFFSARKGFGFIRVEGHPDMFVHFSNIIAEGYKTLKPEQKVRFTVSRNHKGLQASQVVVLHDEE